MGAFWGWGIVAVLGLLGRVARAGLGGIAIYVYPWALAPTALHPLTPSRPPSPIGLATLARLPMPRRVGYDT
jgi:hypothetical protein